MKYSEEFFSASGEQERARGACDASSQLEYYLLMINQTPGDVRVEHQAQSSGRRTLSEQTVYICQAKRLIKRKREWLM